MLDAPDSRCVSPSFSLGVMGPLNTLTYFLSGHTHLLHATPSRHWQSWFIPCFPRTILYQPALQNVTPLGCHWGHRGPVGSGPCTQPLLGSHWKLIFPCVASRDECPPQASAAHVLPFLPFSLLVSAGRTPPQTTWMVFLNCFILSVDFITCIPGCHRCSYSLICLTLQHILRSYYLYVI